MIYSASHSANRHFSNFGILRGCLVILVGTLVSGCDKNRPSESDGSKNIPNQSPPVATHKADPTPQPPTSAPAAAAMSVKSAQRGSALKSRGTAERAAAIRSLLSKERGVDKVVDAIRQEADGELRFHLRAALFVEMNRPSALRLVETCSADDPDDIKAMVKETAIQFGDAEMLQAIADRFDNLPPKNPLRPLLAEMVREIRNPEAVEGLTRLGSMAAETEYAQDELAWSALVALADMGTAPSVDGIITVAESIGGEKGEGVGLIFGRIRSSEALPVLIPTAKGQGRDVRLETRLKVIPALSNYADEAAVLALEELTRDNDPRVSKAAQAALQRKK